MTVKVLAAAEESIIIYLAEQPNEHVLEQIQLLSETITEALGSVIVDLVPSFTSLTVYYDILATDYHSLRQQLLSLATRIAENPAKTSLGRAVEIPVYYGDEVAEDLQRVGQITGLTKEQVIALHTQHPVRVYALGFRPGFGFMGTLPDALRAPRLDTPRQRVPKGAVAITEGQTAVYPDVSPGGWNIIGRCPLPMFDRSGDEPKTVLQVGDQVHFKSIDRAGFLRLGGELPGGEPSA